MALNALAIKFNSRPREIEIRQNPTTPRRPSGCPLPPLRLLLLLPARLCHCCPFVVFFFALAATLRRVRRRHHRRAASSASTSIASTAVVVAVLLAAIVGKFWSDFFFSNWLYIAIVY